MTVRLNGACAAYARDLIKGGKVNKAAAWSFDAADGDKLLGSDGSDWGAYSKVFLGEDDGEDEKTKGRWKYPVIKGGQVYRRGVIAAKSRAGQQDASDIEDAAGELLTLIDGDKAKNADAGDGRERRFGEVRLYDPDLDAQGDNFQRKLGGYAAKFNTPTVIAGSFREQIAPGAFKRAIASKGCDVRALFNHDPNYVIGRTVAKTLRLKEDDAGLRWEADAPDTSWSRDLCASIHRGDISQCSFQFQPRVQQWDFTGDMPLRTLQDVDLYDVSAVTFPAYDDTDVALRTLAEAGHIPPLSDVEAARIAGKRSLLDRLSLRAT